MFILRDVQFYISLYFSQLPPGMGASLGDKVCGDLTTWEKLRAGNYGARTHRKTGSAAEVGFHQRICVRVKPLIPILTGRGSPPKILDRSSATVRSV